jgi:hypothetical protein
VIVHHTLMSSPYSCALGKGIKFGCLPNITSWWCVKSPMYMQVLVIIIINVHYVSVVFATWHIIENGCDVRNLALYT